MKSQTKKNPKVPKLVRREIANKALGEMIGAKREAKNKLLAQNELLAQSIAAGATLPLETLLDERDRIKWSVEVEKLPGGGGYRTMFTVGVQSFELAHVEGDPEAKTHCNFIRKMFLVALANLGVKHDS